MKARSRVNPAVCTHRTAKYVKGSDGSTARRAPGEIFRGIRSPRARFRCLARLFIVALSPPPPAVVATLLIQNGKSLAYVRDQLGHASIQLTVDIYGHLVPGANRQAVDKLDNAPEVTTRNPAATEDTKGATA